MTLFDFTLDEIDDTVAQYRSGDITQCECKARLADLVESLRSEKS